MRRKPKTPRTETQAKHFELKHISPMNANQQKVFLSYEAGRNLMLHGYAGTGKTFCALYLALKEVLTGASRYAKVVIVRSVVPSRDMGFLPGNIKEKARIYEEPYQDICDNLFGRGDGYEILKLKNVIEFTTTSHLRGKTFDNAIVVVDETNNMTFQELDTIMTRMGDNSRIIFCGDFRQTDLNKPHDKEGIRDFMKIIKRMKSFDHIEFELTDIVRSPVVRNYIVTKTNLQEQGELF